jgi:hypothetical protein
MSKEVPATGSARMAMTHKGLQIGYRENETDQVDWMATENN